MGIPFDGWTSRGREDVEVPGATSAERWRFTYRGDDGDVVSGVWLVVADEATGRPAAVQLTGAPLDEAVAVDVLRSVRFDPGAAPAASR